MASVPLFTEPFETVARDERGIMLCCAVLVCPGQPDRPSKIRFEQLHKLGPCGTREPSFPEWWSKFNLPTCHVMSRESMDMHLQAGKSDRNLYSYYVKRTRPNPFGLHNGIEMRGTSGIGSQYKYAKPYWDYDSAFVACTIQCWSMKRISRGPGSNNSDLNGVTYSESNHSDRHR